MTDVIEDILRREGGYVNNPNDRGGETAYGISKAANPQAWVNGPPTEAQARAIYQAKYLDGPGFSKVTDPQLQAQLTDFGVNSGPMVAIQKLQEILHVPADGVLGPQTLALVNSGRAREINNALVASRVRMIGRIVQKNPSQLIYLFGWLNRSLEFIV